MFKKLEKILLNFLQIREGNRRVLAFGDCAKRLYQIDKAFHKSSTELVKSLRKIK